MRNSDKQLNVTVRAFWLILILMFLSGAFTVLDKILKEWGN
jgi:hypothetical protein